MKGERTVEPSVRRATAEDAPEINRLLRQVLDVHHRIRPDLFKPGAKKYSDDELLRILADDERPVFVATAGARFLGYAFCVFERRVGHNILSDVKSLYLDDLCVDESARGLGVGTLLYEYVKAFARANGCYNVTLNVWAGNDAAKAFYEARGLRPQKFGMEEIL